MKKLLFLSLFLPALSYSQLTVNISYAYNLTPLTDTLFLAGTFNAWLQNSPAYEFKRTGFNVFSITFNPPAGAIQYKVTRGTWASVECDSVGGTISNRTFTYSGSPTAVNIQIPGWTDIGGKGQTTAAANVHLLTTHFPMPQLNSTRKVWVYLPPDYLTSAKKYPVLYMHDGQNLFDVNTSFSGEWQVDESLNTLFSQGDYGIIVVGIDNGPNRIGEYSPWINSAYGGGQGAQYVSWMVSNLKPYIDSAFRTNPTPKYTGIMGSSMGGLISQYGGIQFQNTWKKVGLLSPSFWFADSIFVQEHNIGVQKDMKFYFESGSNEDATMVPLMIDMEDSLLKGGLDTSRVRLRTYLNGQHAEAYWALYFPIAYKYLFADLNIGTGMGPEAATTNFPIGLFPNPASDKIYFQIGSGESIWNIQLLNINGEVLYQQKTKAQGSLNTDHLPAGIYFLKGQDAVGNFANKKFIIEH